MLGIIDLIILVVMVISVLFALYRGLVRELLGISSWILAGFVALYSYNPLLELLASSFENVKLAAIIGSAGLALVVLIVMTIVNACIAKRLRKSSLSGLDRIFGFVFGIARAMLIVALIYIFVTTMMLSPRQLERLKKQNISLPYVEMVASAVQSVFPENIKADLSSYQATKRKKVQEEREAQKKEPAVTDYKQEDRKSLDDMIENIVEIGDIE